MSNTSRPGDYNNSDEITLKELILKIQDFWAEIWKQKLWIVLFAGLVAAISLYNAITTVPIYSAKLTFMVNEDKGGRGGISSLLGQFGFGGGKGGEYNLDKIVSLGASRRILQEPLFVEIEVNGEVDYIANHIIRLYDMHESWEEDKLLNNFLFTHDSIPAFSLAENKALRNIHSKIVGGKRTTGFLGMSYKKKTGVLTISTASRAENLSIELTNKMYEQLSQYYVTRAVEPQQITFNTIKVKTDSLKNRLDQINYTMGKLKDTSYGLIDQTASTKSRNLRFEQTVTATAYGEALKNLELSDFTLRSETPAFQLIDAPIHPISGEAPSVIRSIIIGGAIGVFLAILFFIIRKVIRNAMNE